MKRLFIAIKIVPDENMLRVYYSLRQALSYNKIRWVEPDNFHLTLKFLGNTPEEKIPHLSGVIVKNARTFNSFDIEMANIGIFGSSYKPRVVWFGIKDNNQLINLGTDLIDNLDKAGFLKDRQNFVPHLTIGRITKIEDKQLFNNEIKKVSSVFLQQINVGRLILYESILTSGGPHYNVIESYNLAE